MAKQQLGVDSDVYKNLERDPERFLRKAEMVNRYFAELSRLYAAVQVGSDSKEDALARKQRAFEEMQQACKAAGPPSKSFNQCLSAPNNAGLAFDETYAKYYPIMYGVYRAKREELKPTLAAIQTALNAGTEPEALRNLEAVAGRQSVP